MRLVEGCGSWAGYLPATEETYFATASIWDLESCPLNDGMGAFPFVTRVTASWKLGFASSRFGPIVPVVPASARVWQFPQPAEAKTLLPSAVAGDGPGGGGGPGEGGGGAGEGGEGAGGDGAAPVPATEAT